MLGIENHFQIILDRVGGYVIITNEISRQLTELNRAHGKRHDEY